MYKSFISSNIINEDNNNINNLLNKINDNENTLDLFNNRASYRLGDSFNFTNDKML